MPRDDGRGLPSGLGADLSDYDGQHEPDPFEDYEFTIQRMPLSEYKPALSYRLPKWAVRWIITLSVLVFGAILVSGSTGGKGVLCGSLWLATAGIASILWALEG